MDTQASRTAVDKPDAVQLPGDGRSVQDSPPITPRAPRQPPTGRPEGLGAGLWLLIIVIVAGLVGLALWAITSSRVPDPIPSSVPSAHDSWGNLFDDPGEASSPSAHDSWESTLVQPGRAGTPSDHDSWGGTLVEPRQPR